MLKANKNGFVLDLCRCIEMWYGLGMWLVWVRRGEGKKPLERPRRRWVDNIRIDLQEV